MAWRKRKRRRRIENKIGGSEAQNMAAWHGGVAKSWRSGIAVSIEKHQKAAAGRQWQRQHHRKYRNQRKAQQKSHRKRETGVGGGMAKSEISIISGGEWRLAASAANEKRRSGAAASAKSGGGENEKRQRHHQRKKTAGVMKIISGGKAYLSP